VRSNGLMLVSALALITGCSMTHGDSENPKKNPHPVKRYEVTATADAPGLWDSVKGRVAFKVVNRECVPQDSFTGARNVPNTNFEFEMTRVDDKTWKGYFYRDLLHNEDYFGLGVCHWDVSQASPSFNEHGENFVPASGLESTKPYTEYFKKSDFTDRSQTTGGYGTTPTDPEITQHHDAFFPITVTVKEITP
jgi:hypothetical protein